MRHLLGPILLLLTIHAFSQTPTPRTHTFNSSLVVDTIGPKSAPLSASMSAARQAPVNYRPLQGFEMRAQLPADVNAKTVKTVTLSGIMLQITMTPSTCDGNNGTIVVSPSNGTAPYQFQLDGGSWTYSSIFFTNSASPHTVSVKDAAGLSVTTTVTVTNNYDMPSLSLASFVYPSGCMAMDGSATLQASGGTPPYTFSLDDQTWQTSPTFPGLGIGWYYVYVKDANGCTNSAVIQTPTNTCADYVLTMTPTCGSDGKFSGTMTPVTPNPPYSFSLDGGSFQGTMDFTGLLPGVHIIHIKDGSGTVVYYLEFSIPKICHLGLNGTTQDATCNGSGGSINVTGVNGTSPYLYSIDGINYQSGNSFSGLVPGNYTVVVKDAANTLQGVPVTIYSDCITGTAISKPGYCGNNDGAITATTTGGTPPYSYTVAGGTYNATNTTGIFPGLAPGSYTVSYLDSRNIRASGTITVGAVPCLTVNAIPSSEICQASNGQINAAGTGGTAPYSYSLSKAGVSGPFQSSPLFTGLAAGNYTITAKDFDNRTASIAVVITEVNAPGPQIAVMTTAASCRNNDGAIQITGLGGTMPYQFSIDGSSFVSSSNFNQLATGTYVAAIRGADGCVTPQSTVVALINTLTISAGPDPTICEGKSVVLPASSNGSTFAWQPSIGLDNASLLQPLASPGVTTLYNVTATDGPCQATGSVSVIVRPAPTPDPGENTAICYGASTQLKGGGGTIFAWTPVTYLSDPTSGNPVVEQPEQTMTYSLSVTDANGCQSLRPVPVTVTVSAPPQLSAGADTSVVAGEPLQLNAVDVNATGFKKFTWSPSEGLSDAYIQAPVATLSAGTMTYTVNAVSDAGCAATASITIKVFGVADIFVPSAFSPNGDGRNDILRPLPVGIREFKYFAIFSRWGQRVFYSTDANKGWTGSGESNALVMGTYVWMAAGIDYAGKLVQRKGTVIVVR